MLTACSPRGAIPAFPQCLLQQASQIVPSTPPQGWVPRRHSFQALGCCQVGVRPLAYVVFPAW